MKNFLSPLFFLNLHVPIYRNNHKDLFNLNMYSIIPFTSKNTRKQIYTFFAGFVILPPGYNL